MVTFIKSILSSIPIFTLVPKVVIKTIESHICNFLWDSGETSRKHWVSWRKICKPITDGGMDLSSLPEMVDALRTKMAWKIIERKSLWSRFIHLKYGADLKCIIGSSNLWKNLHLKIA
uniref:Uncharacterized protein n=1 Tax=Kalanchoe fedtschenkoi TaxID=63787 RepID=A0A7N0VER3_KALFE